MSYGCFYFFLSTGGGDSIKSALTLFANFFNNCPRCSKRKYLKFSLTAKRMKLCKISFHAYQVGDLASFITTFFLCLFTFPVSLS